MEGVTYNELLFSAHIFLRCSIEEILAGRDAHWHYSDWVNFFDMRKGVMLVPLCDIQILFSVQKCKQVGPSQWEILITTRPVISFVGESVNWSILIVSPYFRNGERFFFCLVLLLGAESTSSCDSQLLGFLSLSIVRNCEY
jgi:hypothetical protein